MNLLPGDILFFKEDQKSIASRLVSWLERKFSESAGLPREQLYTHVGMVSTEPGLLIEMKWPEPKFSKLAELNWPRIDVKRPNCDATTKILAIRWCYLHIGYNYRWSDYLLGKLGLTYAKRVCSGWLNSAFMSAGYPIVDPKDHLPSPCDMAVSDKLTPVV